jgi:hypothetical protein
MDVKTAIQTGDADALRRLIAEQPARANLPIEWGKHSEIRTHPLHFVSDMLFEGVLERGADLPVIEVLLEGGADCNHQAANGETPLIGAASLGAEEVGLRLLEAGARPDGRGIFGATALHWAAHLGLDRLVAGLITADADVNLKDTRYDSPPLGWALHGRFNPPAGGRGRHPEVIALLIGARAAVDPEWLADDRIRADVEVWSALTAGRR